MPGERRGDIGNNNSEKKEIPEWAKPIHLSYKIFFQTLLRQEQERRAPILSRDKMNYQPAESSRSEAELGEKARVLFKDFIEQAKDDLPTYVPLDKAVKENKKVDMFGYMSNNYSTFYLPESDWLYRINMNQVEDKYIPGNQNFVGFENLFLKDPEWGITFKKGIMAWVDKFLDKPKFRVEEILKIINFISQTNIKPETRHMCENVKDEIKLWQTEAEKQQADIKHKHAEELKIRLTNLLQSIKDSGLKLPDRVKGYDGPAVEKDNKVSFLLPLEKKIIKVPFAYRKKWHGKDFVKKYDFNSAEEAGDEEIIRSQQLVDDLLREILPQDIYMQIMKHG